MSDLKLKACPIPGCGGEARQWTDEHGSKWAACCNKQCPLWDEKTAIHARAGRLSPIIWNLLPHASESVLEVAREMREVFEDGYLPNVSIQGRTVSRDRARDWISRLSSAAPGMGTPGEVQEVTVCIPNSWSGLGLVHATHEQAAKANADVMGARLVTVPVIGAPSKGECEGCKELRQVANENYEREVAALQRAETAERENVELEKQASGVPRLFEQVREALGASENDSILQTAIALKAKLDTALAGEAKARTERDREHSGKLEALDQVLGLRQELLIGETQHKEALETSEYWRVAGIERQGELTEAQKENTALAERVRELEEAQHCHACSAGPESGRDFYCTDCANVDYSYDVPPTTAEGERACGTCGFWLGGGVRGRCNHKTAESGGPRDWCSEHTPRNGEAIDAPTPRAEALQRAREQLEKWHFKYPSHERGGIGRFAAHLLEWAENTDRRRAEARRQLGKMFVEGRDEAQLVLAVNELIGEP